MDPAELENKGEGQSQGLNKIQSSPCLCWDGVRLSISLHLAEPPASACTSQSLRCLPRQAGLPALELLTDACVVHLNGFRSEVFVL